MRKEISSVREFLCTWIEYGEVATVVVTLDTIFEKGDNENDYEYNYALQDDIDTILDLKVGETIPFQFNRDNKMSVGVLHRKK